jgi:hypothetical protein
MGEWFLALNFEQQLCSVACLAACVIGIIGAIRGRSDG